MPRSVHEIRAAFRALHREGCFKLPNPWDPGSARVLESLGFEAIASSSAGFAWTLARPDNGIGCEDVLPHLEALCRAVDIPVNADFESGFAADAEGVAHNVARAVGTGIAGLSIEDRVEGSASELYGQEVAVERIRAARAAIDATGEDVVLVGRTEGLLVGGTATAAIERLVAFADAGADCLYAPGIGMSGLSGREDVVALVRAVAPKPVNVLLGRTDITLAEFADMGVRRISLGGALSSVAWAAAYQAAERFRDGNGAATMGGMPGRKLNGLFAGTAQG